MRDYWRTHIYQLEPACVSDVHQHWTTPDALLRDILPRLALEGDDEQAGDTVALDVIIDSVNKERLFKAAEFKRQWTSWLPDLEQKFAAAFANKVFNGNQLRAANCNNWLNVIRNWLEDESACELPLTGSAFDRFTPAGLEKAVKTPGDLSEALVNHPAWKSLMAIRDTSAWLPSCRPASLNHAVMWVRQRFEQEKQRRAELGFDDILLQLNRALLGNSGQALAEIVKKQFPVAMIDEFQDTDPVQYSIFKQIYRIEEAPTSNMLMDDASIGGIFLIGDPKQAIYAFRNADIFTYLQARRATSGRHYSLDTNFRSSPAMISAVNQVFSRADDCLPRAAFMFGTPEGNPLPFVEVTAREPETVWVDVEEASTALSFWTLSDGVAGKGVKKSEYVDYLSNACATVIVQLLTRGKGGQAGFRKGDKFSPLKAGDIAVLVNKRDEAAAVRQALRIRGVSSVYLSDRESVLGTAQAKEIRYWLAACADPLQLGLLRAALATPSMGISDAYLAALSEDELLMEAEIARFARLGNLWQSQGVLPMLRALLIEFGIPARLIGVADGERQLTDLLHIAEVLQQESVHIDGRHALIRHYVNMLEQRPGTSELLQVRLESDADVVQVVTVHKSKGLEYPLVFLPFAVNYRAVQKKDSLIKWHDQAGQLQIGHGKDEVPLELADDERLAEDVRKLYVALTRARYRTWVGVADTKDWDRSGLGYLTGWSRGEGSLSEALQATVGGAVSDDGVIEVVEAPQPNVSSIRLASKTYLGPALTPKRAARENWWIASYSAIAAKLPTPDSPQESIAGDELVSSGSLNAHPTGVAFQHTFPRGAMAGVFLHSLFEWIANHGFSTVASGENTVELKDMLRRRCLPRGWMHWLDPLENWLLSLLDVELGGVAHPQLTLGGLQVYQVELEFWFETRMVDVRRVDALLNESVFAGVERPALASTTLNGMLKGFIDLVFEFEGEYFVLDYKSNYLGSDNSAYTRVGMQAAILGKRYDLQFVLYLLALHRLLRARLPDYSYEQHIGGAIYFFLRGHESAAQGVFAEKPPKVVIDRLDSLFCADGLTA